MRHNRFICAVVAFGLVGVFLHFFGGRIHSFFDSSDDTVAAGAPILECPAIVNVGPVEYGTVIEANFSVANRGGSELVLNEFRSGCTCESIEVKRGDSFVRVGEVRLKPNESALMRLVMSVSERARESMSSPIYFHTNVPDRPEARLVVDVPVILAGLSAVPRSVTFGEVPVGSDSRHLVQLFDARTVRRRISEVRSSDPERVRAKLLPSQGWCRRARRRRAGGVGRNGRNDHRHQVARTCLMRCDGLLGRTRGLARNDPSRRPSRRTSRGVPSNPPPAAFDNQRLRLFRLLLMPEHLDVWGHGVESDSGTQGVSVKVAEAASGGLWKIQVELTDEYGIPEVPRDLTVKLLATLGERQHEIDVTLRIQPGGTK